MRGGRWVVLASWLALLAMAFGPLARAGGQVVPEKPADYAGLGLGRIALLDLRTQANPGPDDYRIVQLALGLAREPMPRDTILLRRQIEAAWSAGRDDEALQLTRDLLRLDPADEVSLLRVIAAGVENIQTIEERLAAYDRLLGATGLSPAVRSRLALDAALLVRETGDGARFVDLLSQATELDSTNKSAAALALAYYEQADAGEVGRLELMLNLLMADPVDPNVHRDIAQLLTIGGAFEQAIRFHDHHQRLLAAAGYPPSDEATLRRFRLRWLAYGPAGLAEELELPVLQERARLEEALKLMVQRGQTIEGVQKPADIVPPPDSAMLRMIVADAEGNPAAASRASEDLRTSAAQRLQQMLLATQGDRLKARQVALLATGVRAENALAMILAGVQFELVRADLRQAMEAMDRALADEALLGEVDPGIVAPARAQLELVAALIATLDAVGSPEADQRLEDLRLRMAEQRVPRALLAYVHALLVHGRTGEALPLLRAIVREDPASMWGAWSHQKLVDLGVGSPFLQSQGLDSIARAVPAWLDRMVEKPENYMELTVRAGGLEEHPTGITRLRLMLRNNSPIPLAVGPNAPINTRILLSPVLDADMDRLAPLSIPEVASVDTRLRLMPRERLEIDVWAGGGLTGWYIEAAGSRTTRTRWRAIQGFLFDSNRGYVPGPMCLSAETGLVLRRPMPETRFDGARMVTRVLADDPGALLTIAATLKSVMLGPDAQRGGPPAEIIDPVMAALAQRFLEVDTLTQTSILVAMPNGRQSPPAAQFDRAALDQAQAPLPLAAALLTRASDPEDPAFARAAQSEDPRVRELASLLQQRLRAGARSYANFRTFGAQSRQPDAGTPTP